MIITSFIFPTYTLCTWPIEAHTNCVCDQFNCFVIKQITSTSWKFPQRPHTVSPFQSFILNESHFPKASTYGFPQVIISSWPLLVSSVGNQIISFATKITVLLIDLRSNFWLFNESTVCNWTLHTSPFESGSIFTTLAIGRLFFSRSSFSNTMSPISKSRFFYSIFVGPWGSEKIDFSNVTKIPSNMLNLSSSAPWVQKSCLSKLLGGGKTTLVFCVSRLLGECGIWLLTLLSVSAVSGIDSMIPSVSANSALKFSSFKLHKWFLSRH